MLSASGLSLGGYIRRMSFGRIIFSGGRKLIPSLVVIVDG
jgi:hypothetical protein